MRPAWQPPADPDLAPFWEGAARGVLCAPVCSSCRHVVLAPRPICPRCHEPAAWEDLSGEGTVYSFGVEHRSLGEHVGLEAPYVVALVELAEGGRLVTNIVDPPADVVVGAPVSVVFTELADGRTVPRFRLGEVQA